jgi:hypothetical protein
MTGMSTGKRFAKPTINGQHAACGLCRPLGRVEERSLGYIFRCNFGIQEVASAVKRFQCFRLDPLGAGALLANFR